MVKRMWYNCMSTVVLIGATMLKGMNNTQQNRIRADRHGQACTLFAVCEGLSLCCCCFLCPLCSVIPVLFSLWFTGPNESLPSMTMIGSPNFGPYNTQTNKLHTDRSSEQTRATKGRHK